MAMENEEKCYRLIAFKVNCRGVADGPVKSLICPVLTVNLVLMFKLNCVKRQLR